MTYTMKSISNQVKLNRIIMISKETRKILHRLIRVCAILKCIPFKWNDKGHNLLTPESKLWKLWLNNILISCYTAFLTLNFRKTLKGEGSTTTFAHIVVIFVFFLTLLIMFEGLVRGHQYLETLNQVYFLNDAFEARYVKRSYLKQGMRKNTLEIWMKMFLIGIPTLAVLGALMSNRLPDSNLFLTSLFSKYIKQGGTGPICLSAFLTILTSYIYISASLIISAWLFLFVPMGFLLLSLGGELKFGLKSAITKGSLRRTDNAFDMLKKIQILVQRFNYNLSLNIMPHHVAVIIILSVGSNYCAVSNLSHPNLSPLAVLVTRGIMIILSAVSVTYLHITFRMLGKVGSVYGATLRSWRVANLNPFAQRVARSLKPIVIKFGPYFNVSRMTAFTITMSIIKHTGKALITFK